ncbi:MAG TPA: ketoacyl-ACP synthase III [Chloroflexi bacterium]|jgi:3-oxoacyl-[acyl-carrier-protein] synthase-3|nr:ketoacyl-ACP synthase III [Chloroflexota bacterium]
MYAPEHIMTNDELAEKVDTSDEWIRTRTGIASRHVAGPQETTTQMSIAAARNALQVADADPREIGLIIVGTATPDHIFPSTACQVQDALGAIHAGAVDINAGCSGFVYALILGHWAIVSGEHDLVLVIGADTLTRKVDWEDRSTCILFGDGAGAVLLRASDGPAGILSTVVGSDGSGGDLLIIPAGGSAMPPSHETVEQRLHYIRMNGREVFRFATQVMPQAIEQVAEKAGFSLEDISLVIPHQANMRIIESAAKRLKLPMERFVLNLERYGNTSAASVPIALCEAIADGRIQPGQNLVMVGFGAGLTWAAVALRWMVPPEEVRGPIYHNWWRWLIYRWAALRRTTRRITRRLTVGLIRWIHRTNGDYDQNDKI